MQFPNGEERGGGRGTVLTGMIMRLDDGISNQKYREIIVNNSGNNFLPGSASLFRPCSRTFSK
jgi:hypothetical protein